MRRHPARRIESDENPAFRRIRRTLSGREVRRRGMTLVSGPKTVAEVCRGFPDLCEAWITTDGHAAPPEGWPDRAAWYQLSRRLFRTVDVYGTDAPLVLVHTPSVPRWRREEGFRPGCNLLVSFQDPENVGAVIRSAVAFGAGAVILLAGSASPFHPKAIRASGGVVFGAPLLKGPAVEDLSGELPVVGLSAEGADISRFAFPERFGLFPGPEGPGLPERFRPQALAIPIHPNVESLNAATAAAIALYLWSRTRGPEPKKKDY